jgi:hypothetical protein
MRFKPAKLCMSDKASLPQEAILTERLSSHSYCLSPHLEQEFSFAQAFCSRVKNNFTKRVGSFDSMTCALFGGISEWHEIWQGIFFLLQARRAKEGF